MTWTNEPRDDDAEERSALEADLHRIQFSTPPLSQVWRPGPDRILGSRRLGLAMLAAVLVLAVGALIVAGSEMFPPVIGTDDKDTCAPDSCGVDYYVSARLEGGPDRVFAFDVVVENGTDDARLGAIAARLAELHPADRVIVWFFTENAGQERNQFGLVPAAGDAEPPPRPVNTDAWRGTYDYDRIGADPDIQPGNPS